MNVYEARSFFSRCMLGLEEEIYNMVLGVEERIGAR